jgi:chromosomal replication initiator protein
MPLHANFIAGPENILLRGLLDWVSASGSTRQSLGSVRSQAEPGNEAPFGLIVLYGPSGVGKSHLLHGLVERQRRLVADIRIAFGTGADFARAFARAVDVDSVTEWRDKQRCCDLFVLDDLQELATKPAAQQELVYTLDSLSERESQSLLGIRQAPLDWTWMSPALRSRIEGGLIIPLVPPSANTAEFICREISIEKALPTEPIRSGMTYEQLRTAVVGRAPCPSDQYVTGKVPVLRSLPKIAKLVAKQFQVKLSDLLGPSRRQSVVRARGVAIYLARVLLRLSLEEIGRYFGRRDHTTVLHSWRKTVKLIDSNATVKHEIDKLMQLLNDNFEIQTRTP